MVPKDYPSYYGLDMVCVLSEAHVLEKGMGLPEKGPGLGGIAR
jgi:hypothetical protein